MRSPPVEEADWTAFFETRAAKLALSALIVVSLIPNESLERIVTPVCVLVLGVELVAMTARMSRAWRDVTVAQYALWALSALVFLSFMPWQLAFGVHAHQLRLLRLTRLLILVAVARNLARDVYSIMTRREMLQQFAFVTAVVAALSFGGAVLMYELGTSPDESATQFIDYFWWTFRQVESQDNLVHHVRHVPPLVAILSIILTMIGVFVVAFIIGIGSNVVAQVVRSERLRPVGYSEHSLIIGQGREAEFIVREFVRIFDKNQELRRIRPRELWAWLVRGAPRPKRHALAKMAVLGASEDPPDYLYEPGMRWVVYRQGDSADREALSRVAAARAKRAIVLSRADAGPDADAVTVAAVSAFRERNENAHLFVEVQRSSDVELVRAAGGVGTFPLDVPRVLGLFLCHHLVAPGVEGLYKDLLTAAGSEFYTHVYVEPHENAALEALAKSKSTVRFSEIARRAYRDHNVVLTGVLLGNEALSPTPGGLIPIHQTRLWVNPLMEPDPELCALGCRPDEIPISKLRGFISVAQTYLPLREWSRAFLSSAAPNVKPSSTQSVSAEKVQECLRATSLETKRVLVVGYSRALSSFMNALATRAPGLEFIVTLSERGDEEESLEKRICALTSELDPSVDPGETGAKFALANGATATLYTHRGDDLASFAVRALQKHDPIDAVVFLSEPNSADRDARIGLRLLRFANALDEGLVPVGTRLHVLAEFLSPERGQRVRRAFESAHARFDGGLRVTLLSTDEIKSYFLVLSAYVPGILDLYESFLRVGGADLVRLDARSWADGVSVTFAEIMDGLFPVGYVPLAVGHSNGEVALNPEFERAFRSDEIRCVYAVGVHPS